MTVVLDLEPGFERGSQAQAKARDVTVQHLSTTWSASNRHPAYASAIADLKASGELGKRCRCRPSPYLNNMVEQDHRFIKKRIVAGLVSIGAGSAENDRRI